MTTADVLVLCLAAWRLLGLWFEEIFRPVRERLVARGGKLAYGANCQFCVSVWAAGVVTALWMFARTPGAFLTLTLAASGAVVLMQHLVTRPSSPAQNVAADRDAMLRNELMLMRSEITRLLDSVEKEP
jgi:hypothetical protein